MVSFGFTLTLGSEISGISIASDEVLYQMVVLEKFFINLFGLGNNLSCGSNYVLLIYFWRIGVIFIISNVLINGI